MPPLGSIGLVAAGGGAGALARVGLSTTFPVSQGALPWSTLLENVSGALLLGWLLVVLLERLPGATWARPLLGTGLLGGYTTFSAIGLEVQLLVADGRVGVAGAYLAATWVGGMAAGALGIAAARTRSRGRP